MALPDRVLKALANARDPRPSLTDAASKQNISRPQTAISKKEQERLDQAHSAYGIPAARPQTSAPKAPAPAPSVCQLPPSSSVLLSFGVTKRPAAALAPAAPAPSLFDEVDEDHDGMLAVMSARTLRLRAARTMLRAGDDALVDHLLKVNDVSLAADVTPVLTARMEQRRSELSQSSCVEFFGLVAQMLSSTYEPYNVSGLSFVEAVLVRWATELRRVTRPDSGQDLLASISIHGIREQLKALGNAVSLLTCRSPAVSKPAQRVHRQLDKL